MNSHDYIPLQTIFSIGGNSVNKSIKSGGVEVKKRNENKTNIVSIQNIEQYLENN